MAVPSRTLRRVSLLSAERTKAVKMSFDEGKMVVSTQNPEFGEAEESVFPDEAAAAPEPQPADDKKRAPQPKPRPFPQPGRAMQPPEPEGT